MNEHPTNVIVIYGDEIAIVDTETDSATESACRNLHRFVDYIQTLDPELKRHEAIRMASAILDALPNLLETSSDLIAGIKAECQELRSHRQ